MADRSTRETLMELLRARASALVPPEQAGGEVFEPYDVRGFTAGSRAHHAVVTTSHAAVEAVAIELSREVPSAARTFRCLPPIERWLHRQGPRIAVKAELDLLLGAGTDLEGRARDALGECDGLKANGGDCATDLGLYISASRRLSRLHAEIAVVRAGRARAAAWMESKRLSSASSHRRWSGRCTPSSSGHWEDSSARKRRSER